MGQTGKSLPAGVLWPLVLLCGLFGAQQLYAQLDTGAILGTVRDQTGAVVPNAKISVANEATNLILETTTASDGSYAFTPIKIGTYTVTAEMKGFERAFHAHIQVNIQTRVTVDFTLVPGAVTQTVEVRGGVPMLQTQEASVGQVVNRQAINSLPLNGRNYVFLAQLSVGVTKMQQDSRGLSQTGGFSANGQRSAQNNFILDGIDNNNDSQDFLNGAYYIARPPVDAIQEFKIQTSDYSAEFGRSAGAVLNASIRSGTNEFHGDVWEFLRNDRLDAADFFENAGRIKKGEFRQNQFGFTFGGPIKKNKTFFFTDYEGTRIRQGVPFSGTVPTLAERQSGYADFSDLISGQTGASFSDLLARSFPQGTVFDPATTRPVTAGQVDPTTGLTATATGFIRDPFFRGTIAGVKDFTSPAMISLLNQIPPSRVDPNAVKIFNLYPLPTKSGLFTNFTRSPVKAVDGVTVDERVDHNISERDRMFGRFSLNKENRIIPGPFPGLADGGSFNQGNQKVKTASVALSETHTFSPTLINEARFGFGRVKTIFFQPFADQAGVSEEFGIQGVPGGGGNGGLPQISIGGLQPLGQATFQPDEEWDQATEFSENLTQVYGSHTFKGGFQYRRLRFATLQPGFPRGLLGFSGVYTSIPNKNVGNTGRAQFVLTPVPATVANGLDLNGGPSQVEISNTAVTDDHRNYYGAYLQDDWKISPKLTLNFGVRWEHFGPIDEKNGKQANFDPGVLFTRTARYLIPGRRRPQLSPSFIDTLNKDGIGLLFNTDPGAGVSVDDNNFGPRFGFAYHPVPKLVVRGGYGLFYGGFENVGFGPNLGRSFPFQFTFNFVNPNSITPILFGNGANATLESSFTNIPLVVSQVNAAGLQGLGIQTKFGSAYTQSTNFTVQYLLLPDTTLSLGYVGTQTRKLVSFVGNNQLGQLLTPDAKFTSFLPFPDFAPGGSFQSTQGNAYYNALQFNVEQRLSHGLSLLGNFTWSQCRSDARDTLNGTIGGFRAPYIAGFGIQGDYGLCDIHIRRVAHFSGSYELPVGRGKLLAKGAGGIMNHVVGGWSIHWILTAQDGQPFTVPCDIATGSGTGCVALQVPGKNLYGGRTPDRFLNPQAFTNPPVVTVNGQRDLSPLGGAPTQVTGPPFHRLDLSIFKQFKTSERTRLEFRAEFFNIANHANFSTVQGPTGGTALVTAPGALDFKNPNFGKITSTVDIPNDPREIQFALKFYF